MVLAHRLADGMKRSFDSMTFQQVRADSVQWRSTTARMPLSPLYSVKNESMKLANAALPELDRLRAARSLAWAKRCEAGDEIEMHCLRIGSASVLHMPGELFVEYQLAASSNAP